MASTSLTSKSSALASLSASSDLSCATSRSRTTARPSSRQTSRTTSKTPRSARRAERSEARSPAAREDAEGWAEPPGAGQWKPPSSMEKRNGELPCGMSGPETPALERDGVRLVGRLPYGTARELDISVLPRSLGQVDARSPKAVRAERLGEGDEPTPADHVEELG